MVRPGLKPWKLAGIPTDVVNTPKTQVLWHPVERITIVRKNHGNRNGTWIDTWIDTWKTVKAGFSDQGLTGTQCLEKSGAGC
jgi:hypothetical protein